MNTTLLGYLSALLASVTGLFGRLTSATKANLDKDIVIRDQANHIAEIERQMAAQNVDEDALKAKVAEFKQASEDAIARSNELQAANAGAISIVQKIAAAITANDAVPITVDPTTLVHTVDTGSDAADDKVPNSPPVPADQTPIDNTVPVTPETPGVAAPASETASPPTEPPTA